MIFMVLSKKYGPHAVEIDDEDSDRIFKLKWCVSQKQNKYYIVNRKTGNYLHRILIDAPIGKIVDHINGNPLDNRKSNLRLCSIKENLRNSGKHKNNTSGYKGVFFMKNRKLNKKWRSIIQINKEIKHLGYFSTREEAAAAYNIAALKYHGEFSRLNQI